MCLRLSMLIIFEFVLKHSLDMLTLKYPHCQNLSPNLCSEEFDFGMQFLKFTFSLHQFIIVVHFYFLSVRG